MVDLFWDELVEQLRAHRQQVASDLARRQAVQSGQFSRDADPVFGDDPVPAEPTFLSVWDLTEQARELARWATQHRQNQQRSRLFLANESTEVPVADMVAYLLAQFAQSGPELSASRLLFLQPDPAHQVSLFLALLEMAESQQLRIRQDEEFAEILLMLQSAG